VLAQSASVISSHKVYAKARYKVEDNQPNILKGNKMGEKTIVKKWSKMTEEEMDKWWDDLIRGVNFDNHEESYNFRMNFPECLICGEVASHWIPAKTDGWLMPVCDKHYNNPKITERQWANARVRRQKIAEEIADLRCHKCGGKPVVSFADKNYSLPECGKCSLADIR
jgi:hypothetical protein